MMLSYILCFMPDDRQLRRKHIWNDTKQALSQAGFQDRKGLSMVKRLLMMVVPFVNSFASWILASFVVQEVGGLQHLVALDPTSCVCEVSVQDVPDYEVRERI